MRFLNDNKLNNMILSKYDTLILYKIVKHELFKIMHLFPYSNYRPYCCYHISLCNGSINDPVSTLCCLVSPLFQTVYLLLKILSCCDLNTSFFTVICINMKYYVYKSGSVKYSLLVRRCFWFRLMKTDHAASHNHWSFIFKTF